ncbi:hypothetical protein Hanom_Chr11g01034041 [Helianthus anomalus]
MNMYVFCYIHCIFNLRRINNLRILSQVVEIRYCRHDTLFRSYMPIKPTVSANRHTNIIIKIHAINLARSQLYTTKFHHECDFTQYVCLSAYSNRSST